MDSLRETKLSSQTIFQGRMLTVLLDNARLPDGKEATREYVLHPGAVAVVPITDDGRVVLVRQYRYPVGDIMLEVPAGKLEKGEPPEVCAVRELAEETGFRAAKLRKAAAVFTTPGFTNELMHLFVAEGLTPVEKHPDEDEFIDVEYYTPAELVEMFAQGKINDMKTLLGLCLAGVIG